MALNIRKLLEGMIKVGASDLHLKVGQKPTIRLHGVLRPVEHPELTASDTESANAEMMPDRCEERMRKFGSVDYSFGLTPTERFRVNGYHQRGYISLALRTITSKILTFEGLNLPAILENIADYRTGMVLVTGITGSGKSSTLAALVTWINRSRREHIITIEDPIEYLFQDDKCIIDQIEVGSDVSDFKVALRHSLRQDPDVILIGEMRDRETIEVALHCVETGHLVLSTLHTPDAKQTILRLLHFFPPEDHHLLTEQLSMNLRAVICQRLLKTADGQGRVPCCEIMLGTPIVRKLVRENRFDELEQVLANGEEGMQSFDSHLVQLIKGDLITLEEALIVARDEAAMKRELAGRRSGADRRGLVG